MNLSEVTIIVTKAPNTPILGNLRTVKQLQFKDSFIFVKVAMKSQKTNNMCVYHTQYITSLKVTIFEDRVFKEVIKLKWGH